MKDDLSLIRQAKKGDEKAIKKILKLYSPLILSTSRRFFSKMNDDEDWMQLARIGIYDAVKKIKITSVYNVKKKNGKIIDFKFKCYKSDKHFSGCVYWCVKQLTHVELRKNKYDDKYIYLDQLDDKKTTTDYSDVIDRVLNNVKDTLHKKLLFDLIKMKMFHFFIDAKTEKFIKRKIGLKSTEYQVLKEELMELVKKEYADFALT